MLLQSHNPNQASGISPVNLFVERSNDPSSVKFPIDSGIRAIEAIKSYVNDLKIRPAFIDPRTPYTTLAKDVGIFPSILFQLRSKVFRPQLTENESGISPVKLFLPRSNTPRRKEPRKGSEVPNVDWNGFLKVITRVIHVDSKCWWHRQGAIELVGSGNSCKLQEARFSLVSCGNWENSELLLLTSTEKLL
ncbi:hypothetical protein ACJIZ3_022177 [Penstemon smallii]|uniref:Uncharacterized protein n=1 Tax=Penstemon smallii TaxID=265156 RepID=A0ABD3SNT7_9LAMI